MRININKKILLSIIIILSITFISTISKAALEFKAGATLYNQYPSSAYQLCYDLKGADSTLGTNQVDPHLMLNKDWAAVVFLAMSTYGNADINNLNPITVNGETRYCSNGNNTGVTGYYVKSSSQSQITASILEESNTTNNIYSNLVNNRNTKYVENLKSPSTDESNRGLGFNEGRNIVYNFNSNYPVQEKRTQFNYDNTTINSNKTNLFRPAIWNIDR